MEGNHEILAHEKADLLAVQPLFDFNQPGDDEQQLLAVFFDLRPLIGMGGVFQSQGMQVENFSQFFERFRVAQADDIDPGDGIFFEIFRQLPQIANFFFDERLRPVGRSTRIFGFGAAGSTTIVPGGAPGGVRFAVKCRRTRFSE